MHSVKTFFFPCCKLRHKMSQNIVFLKAICLLIENWTVVYWCLKMKPFRARVDLNRFGEGENLSYKTTDSTLLKVSTQLYVESKGATIFSPESSSELWSRSVMGPGPEESGIQRVTKRCRLSLLTNSALAYQPKCGGEGGELRGLSQWVQLYTGAQINFGDLTP
jgi:hypothetical protein